MEAISINTGTKKTISWKGKTLTTGIYKLPVSGPIFLDSYGVRGDHVNDLKVHGGIDKACYAYGENHYKYWKGLYPLLEWTYGMLGENLTLSEIDEAKVFIGDIYKVGTAIVQVSQPRRPCIKLAAKFGSNDMIRQFIEYDHPGIYFRVIQAGEVQVGDRLTLELRNPKALSVQQINQLLYLKKDKVTIDMAREALYDSNLSTSHKKEIARHWKA